MGSGKCGNIVQPAKYINKFLLVHDVSGVEKV